MTLRLWRGFRFIAVFFALNLSLTSKCFAGDPQWVEVRSPHFSVITDAGEKRGREVAVKFEQMRVAFGRLLIKATVNLPVPLQIIAFRNSKELRQFSPLWHGKPISLAGLYQSGQDRDFILLDLSAEDPMPVVFHEYAHRLMNGNIVGETQPWFDEGFAEYFATTVVEDHVAKVGFRPPPGDLQVLQQFSWLRIADLFAVRHDSQTYNDGDRRSVFYAESWLVIYYLRATQQFSKLNAYFTAVLEHKLPIPDAIQQAFGMSAAQFEKELRKYLNTGKVQYYPIPLPPEIETAGYTVNPIGVLDAKVVMADMHLHSSDYQGKAGKEFEQILKVEPDNAGALRGLGYAYLQKKDFARAQQYFRKAAERDSKDPRVHYYSAVLLNEEGGVAADADKIAFMKKELLASIALDPTFADAYSLLAFAQSSSGEHEQALTTLKKAVELNPRNDAYQFNLALMYLSNRNLDDGMAILTTLQRSSAPEIASRAAESLQQAEAVKAAMQAHSVPAGSQAFLPVAADESAEGDQKMHTATHPEVIPAVAPASGTTKFMKGKLLSVDCSSPPSAFIRVAAGVKTWKMKVADTKHAIVIGADNFSCSWSNQAVALNYRVSGDSEGSIVSIELQ